MTENEAKRGRPRLTSARKPASAFGAILVEEMDKLSLSSTGLSKDVGVSIAYVSALRTGAKFAGSSTVDKLAIALDAGPYAKARMHLSAAIDAGFDLGFVMDSLVKKDRPDDTAAPMLDLDLPDGF